MLDLVAKELNMTSNRGPGPGGWPHAVLACAFPLLLAACGDGDGGGQGDGGGDDGDSGEGTGFTGTITLDEYDWFGIEAYLGVIQIDLDTLEKRRFLNGRVPWRHPNGTTVFLQGCGDRVSRVAMADARGLVRVGTPCSDEVENPGYSSTDFGVSKLSPDETLIAVEAYYYLDGGYVVSTVVYEVAGERLAIFEGLWAPTWTPDGQLLLTGNGFHLVDRDLSSLRRIDGGQLVGPLNNPAVHPSGERMVFEYNQQIWEMNLDGTELRELVSAGRELRFPTYSPDAGTIVYLARSDQEYYDIAVYFTDLDTGESRTVDLAGILSPSLDPTVVPNGPLSWSE
jgi:hypothetical protein